MDHARPIRSSWFQDEERFTADVISRPQWWAGRGRRTGQLGERLPRAAKRRFIERRAHHVQQLDADRE